MSLGSLVIDAKFPNFFNLTKFSIPEIEAVQRTLNGL